MTVRGRKVTLEAGWARTVLGGYGVGLLGAWPDADHDGGVALLVGWWYLAVVIEAS